MLTKGAEIIVTVAYDNRGISKPYRKPLVKTSSVLLKRQCYSQRLVTLLELWLLHVPAMDALLPTVLQTFIGVSNRKTWTGHSYKH